MGLYLIVECSMSLYKSTCYYNISGQLLLFNDYNLRYTRFLIVLVNESIMPNLFEPLYICSSSATTKLYVIPSSSNNYLKGSLLNSSSELIM